VELGCQRSAGLAAEVKLFYMNFRNPSLKQLRILNRYYFSP
jgi:hypothetical protein